MAIGTSTGGPVALKTVLSMLPGSSRRRRRGAAHAAGLYQGLCGTAGRLLRAQPSRKRRTGTPSSRRVLLAPGNWHMTVSRFGGEPRVALNQSENVNGHRPSVDVLMHSVAMEYGSTRGRRHHDGHGQGRGRGLARAAQAGRACDCAGQGSSVIYGMNREVVQRRQRARGGAGGCDRRRHRATPCEQRDAARKAT